MAEEKLNKFVINYLTEEQYAAALKAGTLNDNDFYCTSNDLENNEQNSAGTETVFIRMFDTEEEEYDKMFSAVEIFDDGVNGLNARLIKNVVYEYSDYGVLRYFHVMNSDGSFNENGELTEVSFTYYYTNTNKEIIITKRAYSIDGEKIISEESENHFFRGVVDNLESDDTELALSANQGKVLAEEIAELRSRIIALESGQVNNVAVDPTDTSDMNLWIQTS